MCIKFAVKLVHEPPDIGVCETTDAMPLANTVSH